MALLKSKKSPASAPTAPAKPATVVPAKPTASSKGWVETATHDSKTAPASSATSKAEEKFERTIQEWKGRITAMVITSQEERDFVVDLVRNIKISKADAVIRFEPQKKAAWESYQVSLKQYKKYVDPHDTLEAMAKRKISDFDLAQRRLQEEQTRLLLEQVDVADTVEDMVPAVVPEMAISKPQGNATTDTYNITVIDRKAFLKAILDGDVLIDLNALLEFKTSVIKAYIKSSGRTTIPGLNIEKDIIQSIKV